MSDASTVTAPGGAARHPSERWHSVTALLDQRAAETPDAPALGLPGGEWTFKQLADSSMRSARWLAGAGVGPGDRVAILLREACEPYLSVALGAMRLGAIALPVNSRNKAHELGYVLGHATPSVLMTSEEFAPVLAGVALPDGCREVLLQADGTLDAQASRVAADDEVARCQASVTRRTPALMLYTSGTTSDPKGCLLSHAALLGVGANCAERLSLTPADRLWTPLALFHVGGWQGLMTAHTAGAAYSHVGFFDAETALDQLERERCTVAFPAFELIWLAVLEHQRFADADLSALRIVINVGIPERLASMQQVLPEAIQVSCMGMTESAGSMCMGSPADPLEARTHTSGRPLNGMELRVVDPAGADCPSGVPGELLFRGVSAFEGYYRDAERTAEVVDADGWIRTGDLVSIDQQGMARFRGRLKDMLKVGGENVSAAEIEGYLLSHPAVAVVAVVGAPDARYGEVPAAFIQLAGETAASEAEIVDFCLGKIATYKVPRYVRFVNEFPTTPTSKIKKFVLRERIESELRDLGVTEAPRLGPSSV